MRAITLHACLLLAAPCVLAAPGEVEKALDSPARQYVKQLKPEPPSATGNQFAPAASTVIAPQSRGSKASDPVQRLGEIRVYSYIDPADYISPQKAPLLLFRDHMDRQRKLSPAEITQLGLCLIGLCGIYGPDGAPAEVDLATRNELRLNQPFHATPVRGGL